MATDFTIQITTPADVSGLDQTQDELRQVGDAAEAASEQAQEAQRAASQPPARGLGNFFTELSSARQELMALAGAVQEVVAQADDISDLASRFRVTAEQLQVARNAAVAFGSDSAAMDDGLRALNRSLAEAAAGNEALAEKFAQFGVTAQQIQSGDVWGAFNQISDAMVNASDKTAAFGDAQDLLGRNSLALRDTLLQGSAAIEAQGRAVGVIADGTVARLADLQTKMDGFSQQLQVLKAEAISTFMDFGESLGTAVAGAVSAVENMDVDTNPLEKAIGFIDGLYNGTKEFNAAQLEGEAVDQRRAEAAQQHAEASERTAAAVESIVPPAEQVTAEMSEQAALAKEIEAVNNRAAGAALEASQRNAQLREQVAIAELKARGATAEADARQRAFDIEQETAALVARGAAPEDARRLATEQVTLERDLQAAKRGAAEAERAKADAARQARQEAEAAARASRQAEAPAPLATMSALGNMRSDAEQAIMDSWGWRGNQINAAAQPAPAPVQPVSRVSAQDMQALDVQPLADAIEQLHAQYTEALKRAQSSIAALAKRVDTQAAQIANLR